VKYVGADVGVPVLHVLQFRGRAARALLGNKGVGDLFRNAGSKGN
jgi:hypothetical protein